MTEEEARETLINLTREYMNHPYEERKELYNAYQESRKRVQEALSSYVFEKKQLETEENKMIR